MITAISIAIILLIPAFTKEDLLVYVAMFSGALAVIVVVHPFPTLSESVIAFICLVLLYTGATYLLRRAVVFVLNNVFAQR